MVIGYAAYRLTILLPEESSETMELALVSRGIRTSCELFVNGRRAAGGEQRYSGSRHDLGRSRPFPPKSAWS